MLNNSSQFLIQDDSLTTTDFKTFFKGGEAIVTGRVPAATDAGKILQANIKGEGNSGPFEKDICFSEQPVGGCNGTPSQGWRPRVAQTEAENFLERLWAFLTIKNSLDDGLDGRERIKNETELRANIAQR